MVFIVNTLLMAISSITYPVIPLYIVGSGFCIVLAGVVTSIASIASFSSQIIWGYISDRIGKRSKVMLYGCIIMVLFFSLATIFSNNILVLLTSYILSSVGSAAVGVSSYALIADISSRDLGKNMSIYWAGGSLGWAAPLLFAGWLLKTYGIMSIFLISLLISSIVLVLTIAVISIDKGIAVKSSKGGKWTVKPIINLMKNKVFLAIYISSFMFMVGDVVKNIYIPQYHAYKVGLGESLATAILSLASWFEIPAILLFGHLLSIISGVLIYIASLASMALYLYFNSIVGNFITASIVMASYSIVWASYITSISVLVPITVDAENKGLALGLMNSNFALANIASNIVLSYMVSSYGYNQTFIIVATIMLALALFIAMAFKLSRHPS
jgi:PPP family 3-phenylpropionic acid transporter